MNMSRALLMLMSLFCGYLSLFAQAQIHTQAQAEDTKKPAAPHASDEARAALAQGRKHLVEDHDAKGSLDDLKKAVKLDPNSVPAYLLLGTAYMQTQQWTAAQSAFEQAAKLEPANAGAYLGIGAALNQKADYFGAQTALRRSLELKADSAEAHYELARTLWSLYNLPESEAHVHKAIDLNPGYSSPHILLANLYLVKEDPVAALGEFKEGLRLDPNSPQAAEVKDTIAKIEKALGQK